MKDEFDISPKEKLEILEDMINLDKENPMKGKPNHFVCNLLDEFDLLVSEKGSVHMSAEMHSERFKSRIKAARDAVIQAERKRTFKLIKNE